MTLKQSRMMAVYGATVANLVQKHHELGLELTLEDTKSFIGIALETAKMAELALDYSPYVQNSPIGSDFGQDL